MTGNIPPAHNKVWRLMVFAVPDRLSGLMNRLGFAPVKDKPQNWWRIFNPRQKYAHTAALNTLEPLRAAGLDKRRWDLVDYTRTRKGHPLGRYPKLIDFAKPNIASGTWRIRQKRK